MTARGTRTVSFLSPAGGLSHEVLSDLFALIGEELPGDIVSWTELELLLAYDWAIRVHLRASDSLVRRRPRPWFSCP